MTITTEVCKTALYHQWPVQGQKTPEDWKRISKNGTAKTAIVRIFQHRSLPIFGTVIEQNGRITSVTFADTLIGAQTCSGAKAPADASSRASAGTTTTFRGTTNGATGTPGKPASNGNVSADEFLFAVCDRENRRTTFAICRRDYWDTNHHLSDTTFGKLLDGLLPKGSYESSESQFSSKLGRKELYEFLLAQGFHDDERFTQYMDGYQPGE